MPPRTTILAIFSMFADVEHDRIQRWIPDPRLQRSMSRCLAQDLSENGSGDGLNSIEKSERLWVHYWVRQWQSRAAQPLSPIPQQDLSQQHLTAYLQESFYWAAQKITQRFPSISQSVSDLFQAASFEVPRLLQNYKPDRGSALKSYATMVLTNILKDQLRQQREVDICSQWSLLRKVSKRRIRETLQHFGIAEPLTEPYYQAWIGFTTCYVPTNTQGTERMPAPDRDCWQRMADYYNQQMNDPIPTSPQQLEMRLLKLTVWIRAYFYPNVTSLNQTKKGFESGEIQDDLVGDEAVTLLDWAIEQEVEQERLARITEFKNLLQSALAELEPDAQTLLSLFYQDQLSQQKIADRLSIHQSQISRRMKKIEARLLQVMLDWVQTQTHERPNPTELQPISDRLKEWLIAHYQVRSAT
jgi:RNA polymerase sigma factor (sigma-70 family)